LQLVVLEVAVDVEVLVRGVADDVAARREPRRKVTVDGDGGGCGRAHAECEQERPMELEAPADAGRSVFHHRNFELGHLDDRGHEVGAAPGGVWATATSCQPRRVRDRLSGNTLSKAFMATRAAPPALRSPSPALSRIR